MHITAHDSLLRPVLGSSIWTGWRDLDRDPARTERIVIVARRGKRKNSHRSVACGFNLVVPPSRSLPKRGGAVQCG